MKIATMVFWSAVGGIVVCLAGTVYTEISRHRETMTSPVSIPTPAGVR